MRIDKVKVQINTEYLYISPSSTFSDFFQKIFNPTLPFLYHKSHPFLYAFALALRCCLSKPLFTAVLSVPVALGYA